MPSGKLELDYKPAERVRCFTASISRGVKSGGFTAHNTVTAPAADPFQPEKLTAYEIGVKSDITRTLRVDASVFYYRYKDQQILGKVFDETSQSFIGRFVNANSRISGGEVDLEWRPHGRSVDFAIRRLRRRLLHQQAARCASTQQRQRLQRQGRRASRSGATAVM